MFTIIYALLIHFDNCNSRGLLLTMIMDCFLAAAIFNH
jgi:hypothetical protein